MTTDPSLRRLPRLYMPLALWQKIMAYTGLCPQEINGFGYIHRTGDDVSLIDVFILEQRVTDGTADVSAEVMDRHIHEMLQQDIPTGLLRFQWHSHVHGAVYCSHIDEANIEELGENTDWIVSLVVNKRGDHYAQLDIFRPFRQSIPIKMMIVLPPIPDQVLASCDTEIADKVTLGRRRMRRHPQAAAPILATSLPADATAITQGEGT